MPSPFPGMDPYLEDPGLWPDVHHEIISVTRELLTRQVGPGYYVRIEERVYISDEDDPGREVIIPDLRVGERPGQAGGSPPPSATEAVQVAEPVVVEVLLDEEIHESYLEIIDRANREVITVIEVLSPTNKVRGSRGRESYRQKRAEVRHSPSHWVEIDLLRTGVPWVPAQMLQRGDYFAYLSRAGDRRRGYVWPIRLPERLPGILIPLKEGDPDVPLSLQQVLDTVYDRAAYERIIDYGQPPAIALPDPYLAWADEILRGKGLR